MKNEVVIEFFKYQLINNKVENQEDKKVFDYTTAVRISTTKVPNKDIVLMTTGQISKLDQKISMDGQSIFDAISRLDPKAVKKIDDTNYDYQFDIPVRFKWATKYCPSVEEGKFKEALDWSSVLIHAANFVNLKEQSFSLSALFNEEVSFETKYDNTDFFLDLKVQGSFSKKTIVKNFKGNIDFSNSHFKERVEMTNLECTSIDCSQSTFDGLVEIRKSTFEKNANFYNAVFKKAPIFSEIVFEKNVNFVNTKMDFTFYQLKNLIEEFVKEKYPEKVGFFGKENYKKDKEKSEYREKVASDFQDSFRLLKNTLIKDGNNLEASMYHRLEMYSKEISLIGVGHRTIQATTYEDGIKNVLLIGKNIDRWQLAFYRLLSDHHTSLLRVFNNLMIIMSICFIVKLFLGTQKWTTSQYDHIIANAIKSFATQNSWLPHAVSVILIATCAVMLFAFVILIIKIICSMKNYDQCKKSILSTILFLRTEFKMLCLSLVQFLILTAPIILFVLLGADLKQSFVKLAKIDLSPIVVCVLLGNLPIVLICTRSVIIRSFCVLISYFVFLCLVLPNIGNHYMDLVDFIKNSKSEKDSILPMLILFYVFLQTITLWSLQKTARKNSIIPS